MLQPDHGDDVAGVRGLLVLAVVRVHLEDAPDPFLPVLGRVRDVRSRLQLAGVHAEVREPSHVRVRHDLERERGEGLRIVGLPLDVLRFVLRKMALDGRHVDRRR